MSILIAGATAFRSVGRKRDRLSRLQQAGLQERLQNVSISEEERKKAQIAQEENHLEVLTTFQQSCTPVVDWLKKSTGMSPLKPKLDTHYQLMLTRRWEGFELGFFHRLLGLEKFDKEEFDRFMTAAKLMDEQEYQSALEDYLEELQQWELFIQIAKGVLAKDSHFYPQAISYFKPFTELQELGFDPIVKASDAISLSFELKVPSIKIIPKIYHSLDEEGNPVKKKRRAEGREKIYQSCLASACLRVLRESFAILPIVKIHINIWSVEELHRRELMDVSCTRSELGSLDLDHGNATDLLALLEG